MAIWGAVAWAAIVLFGAIVWGGDAFVERAASAGWNVLLATIGLFVVNHFLRFVRWHALLAAEGCRVPLFRSLAIFLAGLGLLPTPGKAGVAVRSYLLLREGVAAHVSLAAYFAERLTDLVGLLILATLIVDLGTPGVRVLAATAIGIGCGIGVIAAPGVLRAVLLRARMATPLRRVISWIALFFEHASDMLSKWRLPAFVFLGMLANAVLGLLLWIIVSPSSDEVTLPGSAGIIAASHLSGSISLLPGGLGGFEVALLSQFKALGIETGAALVALASIRVATLWGSVAVGIPLLLACLRPEVGPRQA